MEQMVLWGVQSPWLTPTPNTCVSLLLAIPPSTQQLPGSFGPLLWAGVGVLCLLLRVGLC